MVPAHSKQSSYKGGEEGGGGFLKQALSLPVHSETSASVSWDQNETLSFTYISISHCLLFMQHLIIGSAGEQDVADKTVDAKPNNALTILVCDNVKLPESYTLIPYRSRLETGAKVFLSSDIKRNTHKITSDILYSLCYCLFFSSSEWSEHCLFWECHFIRYPSGCPCVYLQNGNIEHKMSYLTIVHSKALYSFWLLKGGGAC